MQAQDREAQEQMLQTAGLDLQSCHFSHGWLRAACLQCEEQQAFICLVILSDFFPQVRQGVCG